MFSILKSKSFNERNYYCSLLSNINTTSGKKKISLVMYFWLLYYNSYTKEKLTKKTSVLRQKKQIITM